MFITTELQPDRFTDGEQGNTLAMLLLFSFIVVLPVTVGLHSASTLG